MNKLSCYLSIYPSQCSKESHSITPLEFHMGGTRKSQLLFALLIYIKILNPQVSSVVVTKMMDRWPELRS